MDLDCILLSTLRMSLFVEPPGILLCCLEKECIVPLLSQNISVVILIVLTVEIFNCKQD